MPASRALARSFCAISLAYLVALDVVACGIRSGSDGASLSKGGTGTGNADAYLPNDDALAGALRPDVAPQADVLDAAQAREAAPGDTPAVEARVATLLAQMTLPEKGGKG